MPVALHTRPLFRQDDAIGEHGKARGQAGGKRALARQHRGKPAELHRQDRRQNV
jgi:hypothetical protein